VSKVEASVLINAPIEKVFQAIIQPELLPQWDPAVSGVASIVGNPDEKGSSVDHVHEAFTRARAFASQPDIRPLRKAAQNALEQTDGPPYSLFYGTLWGR